MTNFAQQVVSGVMAGSLYALLALAFVLVYRASGVINFSQGEMAMVTTYLAWVASQHMPYALAIVVMLAGSFVLGCLVFRVVISRFEGRSELQTFVAVIMLFLIFDSIGLALFGPDPREFKEPFRGHPLHVAGITIPIHDLYILASALVIVVGLYVLFQRTRLGLALRATATDRVAAELMGVPTQRMLTVGWGLAGAAGGMAGVLIAPVVTLTPGLMSAVLVAAVCALIIGGLESPGGAIIGGVLVGVIQNLVSTYLSGIVDFLHLPLEVTDANAYRDIATALVLLVVLLIRPAGLFGRSAVAKV
ncbi:MAG TPA: branched-chain amino acid ABC transporter permease [Acidimicrobiales bacterium]|nr:branched-chain amino acid ABC transporter permease [Acidimicrobiales bacterium]